MQIKFKIGKFLEALDVVNLTVDKRLGTDTKDVYLLAAKKDDVERIYLYSTDFVAESIIKMDATVVEPGGFPLNPGQLYLALSKRDPEAEAVLTITEDKALVKIGKSQFKLLSSRSQSLKSRLQAMPLKAETKLSISADELISSLRKARTCVSTDMNNPNKHLMRAVSLVAKGKSYILSSTDGSAVAQVKADTESDLGDLNALIPGEFTNTLLSLANKTKKSDNNAIEVITGDRLAFRSGDRMVSVGVLFGKYPDVGSVISRVKTSKTITVLKDSLKDAIDRVIGFGSYNSKDPDNVIMSLSGDSLSIKSSGADDVEEVLEVTIEGNNLTDRVKINGKKFLEIVNSYSTANVKICFPDTNMHPVILTEQSDKITATYVISQLR